jgi:hypothetical protein
MVSLAPPNTYMLPRNMNMNEESDYVLYPEVSQQLYSPEMFSMNNMQSFGLDPNAYSYPPRQAHDSYPNVGAMAAGQMYAEVPQFMSGKHSPNPFAMESPELRAPPSNLSTASGPSAPSSAMGSPYSNHGHAVPHIPEWSNQGLGINPSIVGFDNFGPQDYTFAPSGMEPDFAFHDMNKPSFVGECASLSAPLSSSSSSSSVSTFVASSNSLCMTFEPVGVDQTRSDDGTPRLTQSPLSAATPSNDHFFRSPGTPASVSSPLSSRRFSLFSLNGAASSSSSSSSLPSSGSAGRAQDPSSSPPSSESPCQAFTSYRQTPFFSQTSGQFVAPLESSCLFPLVKPPYRAP